MSQFAAEFPLNGIPKARVTLALGEVANDKRYLVAELKKANTQLEIQVKLTIEPQGLLPPAGIKLTEDLVPKGEFTIFRGYRSGYSYERSGDRAGLTFDIDHWVSDLARSSALSPGLAPGNSADLAFPGVLRTAASGDSGATGGVGVYNLLKDFLGEQVSADLWQKCVYRWFELLAKSDHLADYAKNGGNDPLSKLLGGRPKSLNNRALLALANMRRTDGMPLAEFPALQLRRPGNDEASNAITRNIFKEIELTSFESLAMRTLWDQLISLSTEFMFAVSPATEVVRPVPWTPSLQTPWRRIPGYESVQFSGQGDARIPLRGVALLTSGSWDTGAVPIDNNKVTAVDADSSGRLGLGSYVNPTSKDGLIYVRTPPAWLANIPDSIKTNQRVATKDLIRPGPGGVKEGEQPGPDPATIHQGMNDTLNRFARATYAFETFRQRQLVVHTPLRFDIAPGSILAVELVGTDIEPTDRTDIFGAVTGVSLFVDVENMTAHTAFNLAHVRTTAENSDKYLTVKEHPLYATSWKGGRLVEF